MNWRLGNSRQPIGIDVDGRSINAVQVGRSSTGWTIDAATSIRRQDPSQPVSKEEIRRLAGILERQGFQGRKVVAAVPADATLSAILELPPKGSGAPIEELSRFELAAAHRCDADSIEAACWDLPAPARPREGTSVMAVGCRHSDAEALLDAFEGARLVVTALDVQSRALARACAPAITPGGGPSAILCFGWDASRLVVLLGDEIVYERVLADSGLASLHGALVNELDLDPDVADYTLQEIGLRVDGAQDHAQAQLLASVRDRITSFLGSLAVEMRLSLGYAANEYGRGEVERLLLVGELADTPGLADGLTREWGHDVTVTTPARIVAAGADVKARDDSTGLITAFGLAQYNSERLS